MATPPAYESTVEFTSYTKLDIHSARELMIANTDQLTGNDIE